MYLEDPTTARFELVEVDPTTQTLIAGYSIPTGFYEGLAVVGGTFYGLRSSPAAGDATELLQFVLP
jgi:hypothetical protein